jgi:hypothetical protein
MTLLYAWLLCYLWKAEEGLFAKWLAGLMCLCNVLLLAMMGLTVIIKDNTSDFLLFLWCLCIIGYLLVFNFVQFYFAFH